MPRKNSRRENRNMRALAYEAVVAAIWRAASEIPATFRPRLKPGKRGDAEGYADASVWRIAEDDGKLSDVDIGFVIAFQGLAQRVAHLEQRIMMLENR
jgi:hypothetical protein